MSAFLINGIFRVTGGVPGGDRVRFQPDDPDAFATLGLPVRTSATGAVRVRLAGVDALEAAYTPTGSTTCWHQPRDLAEAGANALAVALGFDRVDRDDDGSAVSSVPAAVPGHLITSGADVHGRAVGFAFAGRRRRPATDLSAVELDAARLRDCANWMLLRQGLAYPVAFSALHPQLRAELVAAADHARGQRRGIWPRDVTQSGFSLADRDQLQDRLVLLPRLFRRLADHLELGGRDGVRLGGFRAYLAARGDRVLILPQGQLTGLDTVVEVHEQEVRLVVPLDQLVFFER